MSATTYYASYGGRHYAVKGFLGKAFQEISLWDKAIKKNKGKLFLCITIALLAGTIFSILAGQSDALDISPDALLTKTIGAIGSIYTYGLGAMASINFSLFKLSASANPGGWEPISDAVGTIKSLIISLNRYEDILQGFGLGVAALYFLMHLLPKLATEQVTIQSFTKEFIKLGVTVFLIFEMGTMTKTVGQMFDALGQQISSASAYSSDALTSQYIATHGSPNSPSDVAAMNQWVANGGDPEGETDNTGTLGNIGKLFAAFVSSSMHDPGFEQANIDAANNLHWWNPFSWGAAISASFQNVPGLESELTTIQAMCCCVAVLFNAVITVGMMFYFVITVYSTVITRLFEFHIRSMFAPVGIASFVEDGLRSPGGRYFKKLLGVGLIGVIYFLIAKICNTVVVSSFSSAFSESATADFHAVFSISNGWSHDALFANGDVPWTMFTDVLLGCTLVTSMTCIAGTTIFKQTKQLGDEIMGG